MTHQFYLISGLLDDPDKLWEVKEKVHPEQLSGAEQKIFEDLIQYPQPDVFAIEERTGVDASKWMQDQPVDVHYHADKVVENYVEARFDEVQKKLISSNGTATDRLRSAQKELETLAGVLTGEKEKSLADVIGEADSSLRSMQERGGLVGHATGYPTLGRTIHGWVPKRLYIVAARPGMGKSAWALNVVLKSQLRTLFFSLEMGSEELAKRMILMLARQSEQDYQNGKIDWEKHKAVIEELKEERLTLVDNVSALDDIEAISRKQHTQQGVDLIIVDYLQLVHHNQGDGRDERVGIISRRMKALAKDLGIPLILLGQLNRGVENRGDKKPTLADLRESGSQEQDADVVGFCYRPEYYDSGDEPGGFYLLTRKNRHGPTGDLKFDCRMEHYRIDEVSSDLPKEEPGVPF